ncbi:hypothetical protein QEJ31_13640 [Pigmentibacter sp. JX0631]|uniref:hypothetical protein n=1 Tax=Pigmentibacter sp. JX0631 TaxID=2976982 RepID=UPI0024687D03|nr:hypothetical protein [Pigmentibacter sp. JX0631]WGL59568.1 hypothetical protein QEJ31_13640 [Pigmentibacter sp. JX0631]
MSNFTKIFLLLGIIVAVIALVLLFFKKGETKPLIEISMHLATYDKKSGNVENLSPNHNQKAFGILQFFSKPNSKNMSQSILCVQDHQIVDKIDLYMPDMGHGSQPPTIEKTDIPSNIRSKASSEIQLGCFKLDNMQLFMTGDWQIRVFYQNGNLGLFDLKIIE